MILKTKTKAIPVDAAMRSFDGLLDLQSASIDAVAETLTAFTDEELETVRLEEVVADETHVVAEATDMTVSELHVMAAQTRNIFTATVQLVPKTPIPQDILDKAAAYDILMGGA